MSKPVTTKKTPRPRTASKRSRNVFASLEPNVDSHFSTHFYGGVLMVLQYLESLGPDSLRTWYEEFPFLERYDDVIRDRLKVGSEVSVRDALTRWEAERDKWEAKMDPTLPLRVLSTIDGVTNRHISALILVGMPEEDSRLGTVFARLQEPLAYRLAGLEFASHLLADTMGAASSDAPMIDELVAEGWIRITNPDAPRAEWGLKVPRAIWDSLRGRPFHSRHGSELRRHAPSEFLELDALILPNALAGRVQSVPALLENASVRSVVIRGAEASGRMQIAGAIARRIGRGIVELNVESEKPNSDAWDELGPLCAITQSVPLVRFDFAPGQAANLGRLRGYEGPIFIVMGVEGGISGPLTEDSITLEIPPTRFAERLEIWRRFLGPHLGVDLEAIAERFHLPAGHIYRAARSAIAHAKLREDATVSLIDVQEATRELGRQRLSSLAERLETQGDWNHVVVSNGAFQKLIELEDRCRYRERIVDYLSPSLDANNCGVRALFTGASGTGKTLAAKILAAVLQKDIYRVDLASVINKYIGETEKNLHRVLSRAEELDVILLLDEGDALLGARTEVRSSNDRYANLETNYLLQRLENYQGIVVVTTNMGNHIDPAFQRRMDAVIEFVRPGREERRLIWELHLANHSLSEGFLDDIASRLPFTGGQIRNTVSAASLGAMSAGGRPVSRADLIAAIQKEGRKAGVVVPNFELNRNEISGSGMEGFLGF